MQIWTRKNADEKAHTLSRRSKNVKKRTKTYEKRILCKFTLRRNFDKLLPVNADRKKKGHGTGLKNRTLLSLVQVVSHFKTKKANKLIARVF